MAGGLLVAGTRRCGARLKREPGNFCSRYVAPGKTRCNLHGGKSTGPRNPARLTPERLAAMHEDRRRWARGLKATGQRSPCGGNFTKSAKEKAERVRLQEDLARKANEAMFRAGPELVAKAFDRLAEATMRLAEATHLEKLARPCDFAFIHWCESLLRDQRTIEILAWLRANMLDAPFPVRSQKIEPYVDKIIFCGASPEPRHGHIAVNGS